MAVKVQFIRALVDAVFSSHGSATREAVSNRLPNRVHDLCQGLNAASSPLSFEDAESVLFSLDQALGDGGGRALEDAGAAYATRILSENGQIPSSNPLFAMQSFGRAMTQAITTGTVAAETSCGDGNAQMTIAVEGRPGLTRLLRYLATGYIRGATRTGTDLKISAEMDTEHCVITATVAQEPAKLSPTLRPTKRPSIAPRSRSLAAQVDAILHPGPKNEPRR